MSSILHHGWVASPYVDRIWAEVSGFVPSTWWQRGLMVLQAAIDDSYEQEGVFVLAGYIASDEQWANFSRDWTELLPYGVLDRSGDYHFKMSEMAVNDERLSRVPAFYYVIEKNIPISISCKINIKDLKQAMERIGYNIKRIHFEKWQYPWYVCCKYLLDMFHSQFDIHADGVGIDGPVDFYFDNQSEKNLILSAWDEYVALRPHNKHRFGATPVFRDDKDFLPLQAADFWAWWVRKWYIEGDAIKKASTRDFGLWDTKWTNAKTIMYEADEDDMVRNLLAILRGQEMPNGAIFYDKKNAIF